MSRKRSKKCLVVTIAAEPRPGFKVQRFYSLVPPITQSHVDGFRLRMSRQLDLPLEWVSATVTKPRLRYRWRDESTAHSTAHSVDWWRNKALAYARWLAARDGVALPTNNQLKIKAVWRTVRSKTRGSFKTRCPRQRRIAAVAWGQDEERFFRRKDGQRGAYTHTEFVEEFRFDLPNWDWVPDVPTCATTTPHPAW